MSRSTIPASADASPSANGAQTQLFGAHPLQQGRTTLPGGHYNFAVLPGASVSDGVVVENFTNHSLDFHIYGADLRSASGGGLTPAQPNDTMHEGGAWIVVATPKVTIPAHQQFTDIFTLTIPAAVYPGEHLGAVVAAANVGTTPQGSTIEARIALITVVTVAGTGHPSASLNLLTAATSMPEQVRFAIALSNTGNLLLTYAGSVVVSDGDGHPAASLQLTPSSGYVVPSGRTPLDAVWNETSPRSGKYSARATVTILAGGKPVGILTSQSLELPPPPSESAVPIIIGVAVVGGLILLFCSTSAVRKMRNRIRISAEDSPRSLAG